MCDSTAATVDSPPLRRHNSIATSVITPKKLPLPSTTPPMRTTSLELISLKSPFASYISLRDMLPSPGAAINSPTASAVTISSGYEISIRNHLVKQAAWAYLQPMSASPGDSSDSSFLRRMLHRLSSDNPLSACFSFLYHNLFSGFTRIFHRILDALRFPVRA